MVGVWGVVLLAAVFWSVRNDPPTVPEQRTAGQAVAVLRAASGAVVEAAQDERWVLSLGALRVEECSITPVWDGQEASREVTLYVPDGDARTALDTVADRLPAGYRAGVIGARGGTRLSFFADAGENVGVESEANSADQVLNLRVFTGCRPASADLDRGDPAAGTAPPTLAAVVAEITATGTGSPSATLGPNGSPSTAPGPSGSTAPGPSGSTAPGPSGSTVPVPSRSTAPGPGGSTSPGPGGSSVETMAVACPGGGTASTFVRDAGSAGMDDGPRGVPEGTVPVWADAGGWAYRMGSESVVVTVEQQRYRVRVTTACRAG